MAALTLTTFGALKAAAKAESGARELARGKPVALLAFLAASPGRRASRERLASLLWSDGSSEAARQNLRQTIWYIKRRLGDWLVATDDFLELVPGVDVDRDRFLLAVREHRLKDAAEAYTGEFVPDFAAPGAADFEQWADIERRRLRGVFVGCCDTLARQALASGQFASAVEFAKRARDAAPMDFATWRLLLESLATTRDAMSCVAEVEHLEALAASEDLELDDATRAAVRAARAVAAGAGAGTVGGGPSAIAGAATVGGHESDGTSGPLSEATDAASLAPELIGRETEFRALLACWEAARAGRGTAVLVSGVAGLGKSRLLADFHARLRASRARALMVRANPGDRAVSGGFIAAVAEAVAQRPGAAAISEESARVLVALAPALASAFPRARPDTASGEDALRRRANALLDLIRAVSEESALALLIDDIHWADAESRRVLDAVTARLEGGRVLLVLAARPPLETLGGFATLQRFELLRFDLPRIVEFLTRLGELPGDRWAAELPSQLLATTRGIPLALVETLARLVEIGALTTVDHRWRSDAPALIGEVLRAGMVLEARVRAVGAGARELLRVLSVVGRPVSIAELLRALPGDAGERTARGDATVPGADDARLLELEHRGLVARRGVMLEVAHDEIAAASTGSGSDEERRAAHRRAAEMLLGSEPSGASLQLAARHAMDADDAVLFTRIVRRWRETRRAQGDLGAGAQLMRQLLGEGAAPGWTRRALRAVPLWDRAPRRVLQATALLLFVSLTLAFASVWRDEPPARFEAILRLDEGPVRWARLAIPDVNDWEPGRPIELEPLHERDVPPVLRQLGQARMHETEWERQWIGQAFFSDSGGQDAFVLDASGTLTRIASAPGDDGLPSRSPDGRMLAFVSARWHPTTDIYNIALFDLATGELRRLLPSNDYQTSPLFSPDGTRLAFGRVSFTTDRPRDICVVGVDAKGLDCDWPGAEGSVLVAWLDDGRLLLDRSDLESRLVLDLESRQVAPMPGEATTHVFPRVGLGLDVAHYDRDGVLSLTMTQLGAASSSRPLLLDGRPVRGEVVSFAERVPGSWVARVALVEPPEGVSVDVSHRLRAEAFDSAGRPRWMPPARFRSLDDSIAVVRGSTLHPRRTGAARIEVSVGGLRADTGVVRVVPSKARVVVQERWDSSWASRWRAFGQPEPRIAAGDGGAVLQPNGDGRYQSGVYSRQRLRAEDGVGIELRVSTRFTAFAKQSVVVEVTAGPRAEALNRWDHLTGEWPEYVAPACAFGHGGDGADSFSHFGVAAEYRTRARAPATPVMRTGRFYTLRVQLFPDGRCAAAVDGVPVAVTTAPHPLPDSLRVRIAGHSVGTTIAVGAVQVWTGVRGGVDWSQLESP